MQGSEATKHPADGISPSLPEGQKTGVFILVMPARQCGIDKTRRTYVEERQRRHRPTERITFEGHR